MPMDTALLRFLLLIFAGWLQRRQALALAYVLEENRVLREQLEGKRLRFTDAQRRRLARKGKLLGRAQLRELATVARPDTILGWYRKLIARKYDGSKNRRPGRPRTRPDIVELIVDMAKANPGWGYSRIQGALRNLGVEVGRSTVARILASKGLEPAPKRPQQWSTFLAAHWGAVFAADFFTVEVVTLRGLVRYHVLFVMDLAPRRVELGGVVRNPGGEWTRNAMRGMVDAVDGFMADAKVLILDRDPVFSSSVRGTLEAAGVEVVRLPTKSPNLNAYAERFIGTVRRECLSKIIPLGETHLRRTLESFVAHYHHERNHQGLGNRLIEPTVAANSPGRIRRHTRLGGILSFYSREAA